jgi:hypothetical protein
MSALLLKFKNILFVSHFTPLRLAFFCFKIDFLLLNLDFGLIFFANFFFIQILQ